MICHEVGLNRYTRCEEDFSLAEAQWEATEGFWATVREQWAALIEERETVSYRREVEGKSLVRATGSLARRILKGETLEDRAVSELIDRFTKS